MSGIGVGFLSLDAIPAAVAAAEVAAVVTTVAGL